MIARVEPVIPNAVLISASEIPVARARASGALALATGISEALINTAFGITGSTLAIIFYNYFSTKIDAMTYKIDEAGFSLTQTFAAQSK
jgi:biopolymer transport protein ExbB